MCILRVSLKQNRNYQLPLPMMHTLFNFPGIFVIIKFCDDVKVQAEKKLRTAGATDNGLILMAVGH